MNLFEPILAFGPHAQYQSLEAWVANSNHDGPESEGVQPQPESEVVQPMPESEAVQPKPEAKMESDALAALEADSLASGKKPEGNS